MRCYLDGFSTAMKLFFEVSRLSLFCRGYIHILSPTESKLDYVI